MLYITALGASKIVGVLFIHRITSRNSRVRRYCEVVTAALSLSSVTSVLAFGLQCNSSKPWVFIDQTCPDWVRRPIMSIEKAVLTCYSLFDGRFTPFLHASLKLEFSSRRFGSCGIYKNQSRPRQGSSGHLLFGYYTSKKHLHQGHANLQELPLTHPCDSQGHVSDRHALTEL